MGEPPVSCLSKSRIVQPSMDPMDGHENSARNGSPPFESGVVSCSISTFRTVHQIETKMVVRARARREAFGGGCCFSCWIVAVSTLLLFILVSSLPVGGNAAWQQDRDSELGPQPPPAESFSDDGIPVESHSDNRGGRGGDGGSTFVRETIEQHLTIAGGLRKTLLKMRMSIGGGDASPSSILAETIRATFKWEDLAILVVAGWAVVPMLRVPYEQHRERRIRDQHMDFERDGPPPIHPPPFDRTKWHLLATHVEQVARIGLLVYAVDVVKVLCTTTGLEFCSMSKLPHAFAQSAYAIWLAHRIRALRKYATRRYVSNHPDTYGRMQIAGRFADAALYGLTAFVLLSIVNVEGELGIALRSLLTVGGVGTIAVGLASQGIAQQVLTGLLLASSDRIYEGDKVRLSNGQEGTVAKLGWMETVLRGSDEIMVSIPNADLAKQHVSNLSRVHYSRVKQTLKFKHTEARKLPSLLKSIKEEIRLACPDVVADGSRPFRAVWTNYLPDGSLEVVVDAHFAIRPVGDAYWDNRQRCLQAINRAVAINQVQLAVPPPPVVINNSKSLI